MNDCSLYKSKISGQPQYLIPLTCFELRAFLITTPHFSSLILSPYCQHLTSKILPDRWLGSDRHGRGYRASHCLRYSLGRENATGWACRAWRVNVHRWRLNTAVRSAWHLEVLDCHGHKTHDIRRGVVRWAGSYFGSLLAYCSLHIIDIDTYRMDGSWYKCSTRAS